MALGVVTITEETYGTVKKITFAWTTGSAVAPADDGHATGTTTNVYSGKIERLVTVPGTVGDQPADQYDITIKDADSTDVLMGAGANRSNVNTEQVLATSLGIVANDKLVFDISAGGTTKKGTAYLYIR